MNFRKQHASCEEARQMDMVSYLSSLGHEPSRISNLDYWYLSPLRSEKTPSFKVNRKLNRWYDHGLGKGGNLIDFAILYNNCTVGEFLQILSAGLSFRQPILHRYQATEKAIESRIAVLAERPFFSFPLSRYLLQRRIPMPVAEQFCKEISYKVGEREYFGIGFKNNAGGWEIRNAFFKGSSAPKGITIIENGANEVAVFEGFFDFLSFLAMAQKGAAKKYNFLVLNSVAFFEKSRPFLETHQAINLYLDRDKTGQNCTRQALSMSCRYKDRSSLYTGYKDLNDWIMNFGKSPLIKRDEE